MPSQQLIALLRSPQSHRNLPEAHWNALIEQGRQTQLLGQLAALLQREKLFDQVPHAVQRHLTLALLTVMRRNASALWEVDTLRRAVDPTIPLVLLKGCAYLASADDNAPGRLFSDMDVLVRRQDLPVVEASLMSVGWKPSRVSDYDQAYYRNWMHEVPPMVHVRRHTVVDLHHAINPPVSRFYIAPEPLFERRVEVRPGIFVLSVDDRVIHCALHLLQEGDPGKVIRDLYDFHLLLRQHHRSADSLKALYQRARTLKVAAQIEVAIGAAHALFLNAPVGHTRTGWLQACLVRAGMDANGTATLAGNAAGLALQAYAHWMKMPVHILLPHLVHKSRAHMTFGKNPALGAT